MPKRQTSLPSKTNKNYFKNQNSKIFGHKTCKRVDGVRKYLFISTTNPQKNEVYGTRSVRKGMYLALTLVTSQKLNHIEDRISSSPNCNGPLPTPCLYGFACWINRETQCISFRTPVYTNHFTIKIISKTCLIKVKTDITISIIFSNFR